MSRASLPVPCWALPKLRPHTQSSSWLFCIPPHKRNNKSTISGLCTQAQTEDLQHPGQTPAAPHCLPVGLSPEHPMDAPHNPPTAVVVVCSFLFFFPSSLIENCLNPPRGAPRKGQGYPSTQPCGAKESAPASARASLALGEADRNTGL